MARVAKRAASPNLEYLAKQIGLRGPNAFEVVVSAMQDWQVLDEKGNPTLYYVVDFHHPERGWLALTEARSRLRVRTWSSLHACAAQLRRAWVRKLRVHMDARPQELPPHNVPPEPTRSPSRGKPRALRSKI
jgi:hypothetical protein